MVLKFRIRLIIIELLLLRQLDTGLKVDMNEDSTMGWMIEVLAFIVMPRIRKKKSINQRMKQFHQPSVVERGEVIYSESFPLQSMISIGHSIQIQRHWTRYECGVANVVLCGTRTTNDTTQHHHAHQSHSIFTMGAPTAIELLEALIVDLEGKLNLGKCRPSSAGGGGILVNCVVSTHTKVS